jgi:TRAP-type C4-dicarboxylate transport system permease small subunit
MLIVAVAWIYVVLMMSITEQSVIAGLGTFFFYGVLPLSLILYLMQAPQRRRKRLSEEKIRREAHLAKLQQQPEQPLQQPPDLTK